MTLPQPVPPAPAPWPSPRQGWGTVAVLTLVYATSLVDRQLPSILVDPMRRALALNDTQVSLIIGGAFALFYTSMGLPLGRLADTRPRRSVIAVGLALWSLMTATCGLAGSFGTLLVARMLVGVGEASLTPAAYSMIADLFPPVRRVRAFSLYTLGSTCGIGLSLMIGGLVLDRFGADATVELFGLTVQGWQTPFLVVAAPGLLLALVVRALPEPVRRAQAAGAVAAPRVADVAAYVRAHIGLFGCLFAAMACVSLTSYTAYAWGPSLLIRRFGWSASHTGSVVGIVFAVAGIGGVLAGGAVGGWLRRRHPRGYYRALLIGMLCQLPVVAIGPLLPDPRAAVLGLAGIVFFVSYPSALLPAIITETVPNAMRGQISALYLFVATTVGISLGPLSVGLLNDFLFRDPAAVGRSIALAGSTAMLIGTALLLLLLRTARTEPHTP